MDLNAKNENESANAGEMALQIVKYVIINYSALK